LSSMVLARTVFVFNCPNVTASLSLRSQITKLVLFKQLGLIRDLHSQDKSDSWMVNTLIFKTDSLSGN